MTAAPPEHRSRSPRRVLTGPAGHAALTVGVVVVVFAVVLPRIADYSAAWELVSGLDGLEVAGIGGIALVNLF